ncbi:MAG: diaminopimelate epimerase [Candidatus Marinimicrobia bacterium]|nr:diaminopimelate epimerase [Candidatus Neomarinimicrobiota bacterium]MCF7828687.1 diaminopimelate epimerase [Candidatus Neomarinimicrobiota bacterium]MCF7880428.1 diaminopimelate epimerase [Candidatus Neomarinimicrobiota bacterium]
MKIAFKKVSATGNDFIVIDHRDSLLADERLPEFVRDACSRHTGVGADGVLLLENSLEADYRMRYINSDGGRVKMCGNGARALGWFARHFLLWEESGTFEADDGLHSVYRSDGRFGVSLRVTGSPERINFSNDDVGWMLDTGVPHLVFLSNDVEKAEVIRGGRKYRYHEQFAPEGTNVDFVQVNGDGVTMRTYERGVEDETLACGTGVMAAGLVAAELHDLAFPMQVQVPGGKLEIHQEADEWVLWGEVEEIFTGEMTLGGRVGNYITKAY